MKMNPRARAFLTVLALLSLLSASTAFILETEKQVGVVVATDEPVYEPGEVISIQMNISNAGNRTFYIKEAHLVVIAESWFGLTGHEETRSITVPMVRGERAGGYSKAKLPLYTPPGSYRIDSWVVYGDRFNETHIVMPYDIRTPVVSTRFEVDVGVFFVIGIILALWFFVRFVLISRIRAMPVKERVFDDVARKELGRSLENAVLIVCILGLSLTLAWVGYSQRESDAFSVLYLKPGSYSGYAGEVATFTYGVMCLEPRETKYTLEIYLGSELVNKKDFNLCTGQDYRLTRFEDDETVKIPDKMQFPAKISLVLRTRDKTYETFYWLYGKED